MDPLGRLAARVAALLVATAVLAVVPSMLKATDADRYPHMTWKDMVAAELVLVGKYEKHEDQTMSLRVESVLNGKAVKPGDVIAVSLKGGYSIEDKLSPRVSRNEPKGGPFLCYKMPESIPGNYVPFKILPNARQSAIYFLPSEVTPTLTAIEQVQPAVLAEGWGQAVQGKPMGLLFRLTQRMDPRLHDEAVKELARSRDPMTLAALVGWAIDPPPGPNPYLMDMMLVPAHSILIAVGDRKGDIYNPLWAWLTNPAAAHHGGSGHYDEVTEILGAIDPDRAFHDLTAIISANKPGKYSATEWLGHVRTEPSLRRLLDFMKDPDLRLTAIRGLFWMFHPNAPKPDPSFPNRPKLEAIARPVLKQIFESPDTPEDIKYQLRANLHHLLSASPDEKTD